MLFSKGIWNDFFLTERISCLKLDFPQFLFLLAMSKLKKKPTHTHNLCLIDNIFHFETEVTTR